MRRYLLKRLFFALPVLWLLATLVFLLSKLLPGAFGAEQVYQENNGYYAKATPEEQAKAYEAFLHRTGQDLPLFYFSVTSQAALSAAHHIPAGDSKAVQRMAWQYGDGKKAYQYWQMYEHVRQCLTVSHHNTLLPILHQVLISTDASQRMAGAIAISRQAPSCPAALKLQRLAIELQQQPPSLQFLLPSFRWHGIQNQYHQWFFGLLHGNFGTSLRDGQAVAAILGEAFANTFLILLTSLLLTIGIALELSILLGQPSGSKWRNSILPIFFILDSIPSFVLALLLLVLFASPAFLPLFPVFGLGMSGTGNWFDNAIALLPYLTLPILCLSLAHLPYLLNQFYHSLSDAAGAEYSRTARAKGLSERQVVRRHVLRNALLPMITLLSDFLPGLVAGSVVIETIFAIPGMGRLLITSVLSRDYPVIMAIVLVVAFVKVISHVLADVCYAWADPRIRFQAS